MRKRVTFLGAAVAAALLMVAVAGVAAQTGGGGSPSAVGGFMERLAANLGIGPDQLQSAVDKTRGEMIDEAVQQGRLTQEQADALKQKSAGKGLGGFGHFGFRAEGAHHGRPFGHGSGVHGHLGIGLKAVADAIGIDEATLIKELASGKTITQVAQDHGVNREQLKQRLTDAFGTKLDQLLDREFSPMRRSGDSSATPMPSSSSARS